MRPGGVVLGLALAAAAGSSQAQELSFQFINPSFGGNPFYSDHLLGIATAQRPERASDDAGLTEGEQFARQIQSRILSALSSSIVEAITGSAPGSSGEFTVGDQTIFFERTLSEIRLTITDNVTGEITTIVVPVFAVDDGSGGSPFGTAAAELGTTALMTGAAPVGDGIGAAGSIDGPSLFQNGTLDGGLGLIP